MIKRIKTPFGNYILQYAIVSSKKELKKLSKECKKFNLNDLPEWLDDMAGLHFENKEAQRSLIVINNYQGITSLEVISAIRHETHHACASIYESIGHETTKLDEEPFLYLNDFVFRVILEDYNKKNK